MARGSSILLRLAMLLGGALALSGCDDVKMPAFLEKLDAGGAQTTRPNASARTVERDVEAPEVFQVADKGLWDGRPSLGGVWVAHPDVTDPERVIIRNSSNGQFVIGVVYRPERSTPGPKFQVSSDAAEALGMLAGAPADLNVTALRHEEIPVAGPADEVPADGATAADAPTTELAAAPTIESSSLDPIAAAARALDKAEKAPALSADALAPATVAAAPAASPAPAAPPAQKSALEKPYLQIGIFSVESNANATADQLRRAGMVPTVKAGKTSGKAFWRVIVGPAATSGDRTVLLDKIKALGFTDAYAVTN